MVRFRHLPWFVLSLAAACGGEKLDTVKDPPPVVSAGPDQQTAVDVPVTLEGSATPATGRHIVSWAWTFGDGSSDTQQDTSHAYAAVRVYTVTLVATDDLGVTGKDSAKITVKATAPADAGVDAGPVDAGHEDAGTPDAGVDAGPVDAGSIPCSTTWTYGANPGADTSDCGNGFGTAGLTINLCSAPKIKVTEGSGLLSTVYTGMYNSTTGAWSVSNTDLLGDTQGFTCTFSADFSTFTGNYFFDETGCSAMIPVTGTRH